MSLQLFICYIKSWPKFEKVSQKYCRVEWNKTPDVSASIARLKFSNFKILTGFRKHYASKNTTVVRF